MRDRHGIVGRYVETTIARGDGDDRKEAVEACEIVACQATGENGCWWLLVATHDGFLIEKGPARVRLVPDQATEGPYR